MNNFPKIVGFNTNSEMEDFLFCPTVFLEGCNLKCPYCMNADIINKRIDENKINHGKCGIIKDPSSDLGNCHCE